MICDSFINGMSSNYIRQRLLKNTTLTLDQAYTQAHSLDIAQQNSESYTQQNFQTSSHVAATTLLDVDINDRNDNPLASMIASTNIKKKCFFCGGLYHSNHRSCPANDVICHNCNRKGHYAKV